MPNPWLIGQGLSMLGNIFGQRSARKRQREQYQTMLAQRKRAYDIAKRESPEEIAYRNKLNQRALTGDPDLQKKKNLMMQPIRQMGEESRMRTTGLSIQQGLENSVIAHELRNKVDSKTLQNLSEVAEKISLYNSEYKRQYEDMADQYGLERARMLRNLAVDYEGGRPIEPISTVNYAEPLINFATSWLQTMDNYNQSNPNYQSQQQSTQNAGSWVWLPN